MTNIFTRYAAFVCMFLTAAFFCQAQVQIPGIGVSPSAKDKEKPLQEKAGCKRVIVFDDTLKLPIQSHLIPETWEYRYSFEHSIQNLGNAKQYIKTWNPATNQYIELLPATNCIYTTIPAFARQPGQMLDNKVFLQPMSPSAILQQMVLPQRRSGARVTSTGINQPRLQAEQKIFRDLQQKIPQMASSGIQMENAFAIVEFDENGQKMEEKITVQTCLFESPENTIPNMGKIQPWSISVTVYGAPKGKLAEVDAVDRDIVLPSVEANIVWFETLLKLAAEIRQAQAKAAQQNARAQFDANAYANKTIQSTIQNRREAMSRVSDGWNRTIRGVQEDTDPISGKKIETNYYYNHVWTNPSGEKYYTDSAISNPNELKDMGDDWQQVR